MTPTAQSLIDAYNALISTDNIALPEASGWFSRYKNPVITARHVPINWRYDLNPERNPFMLERFAVNSTFNAGAIYLNGKYLLAVRVEGADRKSFFAIAESPNGIDHFKFWDRPIVMPSWGELATNLYDIRLTAHQDGWIYGTFCVERKDPLAPPGDLSAAIAAAGLARTKDLITWERLPDPISRSQQRNVVLHPEFVDGRYAFYTRPQDEFYGTGNGGGICWCLTDDITHADFSDERIISKRRYHTITESKNGEGPSPIKTPKGWLHLAHGVRKCAAGLRYVLYLYVTDLHEPWRVVACPGGYFMAPEGQERIGDVSNVLFSNGWIEHDGQIFIYYASSDTRMHVATTSVERLLDYCFNTPPDGGSTDQSVHTVLKLIYGNHK